MVGEGGGIERYLRNLIKAFQKIDHINDYTLFTNKDNTGTFDLSDNFKEYCTPVSARFRPMKILWEQCILPFEVKRAGIDVLLSPGNLSPLIVSCPSVVVIHDLIPFIWPGNFSKAELYSLRILLYLTAKKATKIITVSKSSERQILQQFNIPAEKITVVYEACDEKFLCSPAPIENKKRIKEELGLKGDFILYIAPTRPHKNANRMLLAFSLLKKKYRIKHRLVITGCAGYHHNVLLKMIKDLGLAEEVVFIGYIPDDVLPTLYSAASVFIYPSYYEGFGLPVLEAMACGTPVVASNATSLPEVVGDAALLFDPHSTMQISESLYKVLTDEQCRLALTVKGKRRVREFSWEKSAREILKVLQAQ
ncbi:MAG: glycosyltransferase family 4 protein [bacterium]